MHLKFTVKSSDDGDTEVLKTSDNEEELGKLVEKLVDREKRHITIAYFSKEVAACVTWEAIRNVVEKSAKNWITSPAKRELVANTFNTFGDDHELLVKQYLPTLGMFAFRATLIEGVGEWLVANHGNEVCRTFYTENRADQHWHPHVTLGVLRGDVDKALVGKMAVSKYSDGAKRWIEATGVVSSDDNTSVHVVFPTSEEQGPNSFYP